MARIIKNDDKLLVSIAYHHFPHYRAPVLRELANSDSFKFLFWGDTRDFDGIKVFHGDELVKINNIKAIQKGKSYRLYGYSKILLDKNISVIIILGNPNMIDTWFIALIGRLLGKKIIFWSHGWLKKENILKKSIRNIYFNIAHHVFVYGERAIKIAKETGFDYKKVTAIYNSLDYSKAKSVLINIKNSEIDTKNILLSLFSNKNLPIIICTARLTATCRFDLLLNAASILQKDKNIELNILLVGDGPERKKLEELSKSLNLNTCFYGACYDEEILGNLIYNSDLTVSPGKIGLTVIHSLTYGTPAITHNNFDMQMPEVEAIIEGTTGAFFEYDNYVSLALTMENWLKSNKNRDKVRDTCYGVIAKRWNPMVQKNIIESEILRLLST